MRYETQAQALTVEQGKLADRTQEWQASQAAVAEMNEHCRTLEQRVQELTETLAQTLTQLSQETERRKGIEVQWQQEQAEAQVRYETQARALSVEQGKLADKAQEWQASQAAVAEMTEHCRTLEQRVQELTETLAQTRTQLSQEAESRKGVEAKASELAALRRGLEVELAQRVEAEARWRQERQEAQARYETQAQALTAEQGKLADRTQEWQASQAAVAEMTEQCRTLEQRVQALTETLAQTRTQLSHEAESRKGVEAKAGELAALRRALQAELAQRAEAEAQWWQEREEAQVRYETQAQALTAEQGKLAGKTQEWRTVTEELNAARSLMEDEALQRRKLASRIPELERAKAELAEQLDAARVRHAAQLKSVQSLESQLEQRRMEIEKAEESLRAMTAEQRRLQLHAEDLEAQLRESSEQLAVKIAAEQSWRQREAELESCVRKQQDQIGNSDARITLQEMEIRNAKQEIAEQRVIQSVLCAKVHELTTASDSVSTTTRRSNSSASKPT